MVACTQEQFPQPPNGEHPIVATLAVIAIVVAILLITWARIEVHGTSDIEAALTEGSPIELKPDDQRELDAAVTSNRFATGLSP
jgi:hypothetical protein